MHKKMKTPPASWNPAYWEADLWAYEVDGDGGLCQLSQYELFYLLLPYDVHPTVVVLLQLLVFLLQQPKPAPVVPRAPASRGRL